MARHVFHFIMGNYAKVFIPFVLLFLIAGEYLQKSSVTLCVQIWLIFDFFLVLLAYFFQSELRRFISNDINKMIRVAFICNHDNNFHFNKIILDTPTHIPLEFETVDVNARYVLEMSQNNPHLYDISHTVYDKRYLRFSWLKLRIDTIENFISKLRPGDILLYHKSNSILGMVIRLFTRNYWEHTATYVSDEKVIEAAIGGVKKTPIRPWLSDPTIELAVLRINSELPAEYISFMEERVGDGYSYLKVFKMWWRIVTGKTRLCFINHSIITTNFILMSLALLLTFLAPTYTRIQIVSILFTAPYMFDSIHHRIAYERDFTLILGGNNEKP